MRGVLTLAGLGAGAMGLALAHGFLQGDFWREGGQLMDMPWGRVSLVDVYTGLALFAGWVVHRERRAWAAAAWVAGLVLLGNFTACLYVLRAAMGSRGDAHRFWHGVDRPTRGLLD
jgi:hypothetical protein